MRELRICLVLEGCYPYVHGGVSTWMHQYITVMKEHEFVLWVIGAHACDRGKFVYELPDNVVEVHEVFLDDALKLKEHGNQKGQLHRINRFSEEETKSLRELMECSHPDWEVLFHLYHDRKMNPMSFLKSEQFLNILTESCLEKYPYIAFADAFHTMRSMLFRFYIFWVQRFLWQIPIMPFQQDMGDFLPALEDMFTGDRYYLQSMGYTQEKERKRSSGQNG